MQTVRIRQAVQTDLPQLATLLKKLFAIEEDFQYSYELQLQGLGLLLRSENSSIFVAENNGQIVGMITGQLTISTAEGGPSLLIEDLYIEEQSRGLGFGNLLLKEAGKWGSDFGARRMQLLADCDNEKALDFYTHTGWQKTNLICLRNYFSEGES